MLENYYINEYGIYTTRKCYHDDIERVYHVRFKEEDEEMKTRAFNTFLRHVRQEGADHKMRQVKKQFKDLREFLG